MKLSSKDLLVIFTLAFLTALESLSIDLYLPAFQVISKDLSTNIGKVQVSLSMFLGGFAIGQLLWGPLSDRFGRKIPLIIATLLYAVFSILVLKTTTIEELWLYRFLQAFTGSAGVVIARAVVTDRFEKKQTASVFALLGLIMGIAPIIAPSIGNYLLESGHWHNIFIAMTALGVFSVLMVIFILLETNKNISKTIQTKTSSGNLLKSYKSVFKNKQFLRYTIIGSMSYSALLIYISNSPYLIMEKAGFSGSVYSIIFGLNAFGMILATFSVTFLVKKFTIPKIVKTATLAQAFFGLMIVIAVLLEIPIIWLLVLIFLFIFPTGVLLPTTVDLALKPFVKDNGAASALFGFSQLAVTFIFLGIIGLVQGNSVAPFAFSLFACGAISLILTIKKDNLYMKKIALIFIVGILISCNNESNQQKMKNIEAQKELTLIGKKVKLIYPEFNAEIL